MLISHRGIEHGITTDASFIGARISAVECTRGCTDCFNQYLKEMPIIQSPLDGILKAVVDHPLDIGIILGGLEWTERPFEMTQLIEEAVKRSLLVMLYTSMERDAFEQLFPNLTELPIWVKFGAYDNTKKSYYDEVNDVTLAGENQYIIHYGEIE
jgi:hypothetical protein